MMKEEAFTVAMTGCASSTDRSQRRGGLAEARNYSWRVCNCSMDALSADQISLYPTPLVHLVEMDDGFRRRVTSAVPG